MGKPKLLVTSGHPYAGKTTMALKISQLRGFQMISFDQVWAEVKPGMPLSIDKQEEWDDAYVVAMARIRDLLLQSHSVIFDDISSRKWKELQTLAQACGAEYKIIFLNVSVEEITARRNRNFATQERQHVPDENFYRGVANFVPPHGDHVVEYRFGDDLETFIASL